jgi:hypothetical protein
MIVVDVTKAWKINLMPRHESRLACPLTVWPAIALLACHGDPPTGTSPQTVTDIAVVPASAALFTGGTATFQAVATLSDGSQVGLTPAWAATGGAINPLGVYTAGAAGGTFRVVASSAAGLADTAIVTVIPDPLTMSGEVAAAADSFVQSVGVNIHLSYANIYSNFGLVKSMLAELGVKHVRDGGQAYDDPALMTRIHGRMKDLNLTLGIKANYIADAFGDPSAWDFSDTRGMDSVVKYAGAATIESFEGLNEWNSKRDARPNWAGEVRQRQQAIWAHVTSKYPQYLVVGPSFTNYVDACTVGDLSGYQHLGNMHPYPAGEPQTASLQDNIANLQCVNGTSDALVSTETGYQNALQSTSRNRAVSELASGKYVPRLYLAAFNSGVRRSYGYELIDEGVSNTDAEARFGLYRNDGSPKPAATALRALATA